MLNMFEEIKVRSNKNNNINNNNNNNNNRSEYNQIRFQYIWDLKIFWKLIYFSLGK